MTEEFTRFIESWGELGVSWGINRSMARIHAYLLLANNPVDLDELSNCLQISRGNTSMSLKELRQWGIIQRVHVAGDRRDFYIAEPDAWNMLFKILNERKKREFTPALQALRSVLQEKETKAKENVNNRLKGIETLFSTFNQIMDKCLQNKKTSKTVVALIQKFISKEST